METCASHQQQKTHRQQKTLISSHRRPLTRLSHCLALRSVVKHSPSPSIFTHKHLAVLLSFITPIYSLSNHINPLGILLFPHFHITPNQIHKTLSFIPVEIESCRLKISGISQRKLSLKDSVLLCRTRVFKTRDLCGIIVHKSVQLNKQEVSL